MQFTIISAYFFFIKLNFFLFLLDLILIMNLCKIIYTVVSAALAQRSFCALYYNCFQCKNFMNLFLFYFLFLSFDSLMMSQLEINSICLLRISFK